MRFKTESPGAETATEKPRSAGERPPVAIVTGAARGIGLAIARRLRLGGWHVVAADLDEAALDAIDADDGMRTVVCDVSDPESVQAAVNAAVSWHGTLDFVCNNAGIGSFRATQDVSLEEWNRSFAINVTSVMLFGRYAHRFLAGSANGSIVNIASDAAFTGVPARAAYCTTKGAVVSLTRAMAADFVGKRIRVNAVAPAAVDSDWLRQRGLTDEALEEAKRSMTGRIPLGRLGTPEDIAETVAWLASPGAGFITGSVITVDGGANTIRLN